MPEAPSSQQLTPRATAPPIQLICKACNRLFRTLEMRAVAAAMAQGKPCLPAACRLCRVRFSAESLYRLRQHIFEVNSAQFANAPVFTLFPEGFRPEE